MSTRDELISVYMCAQAADLARKTAMFPTDLGDELDVQMDLLPGGGRVKPEVPDFFGGLKKLFP